MKKSSLLLAALSLTLVGCKDNAHELAEKFAKELEVPVELDQKLDKDDSCAKSLMINLAGEYKALTDVEKEQTKVAVKKAYGKIVVKPTELAQNITGEKVLLHLTSVDCFRSFGPRGPIGPYGRRYRYPGPYYGRSRISCSESVVSTKHIGGKAKKAEKKKADAQVTKGTDLTLQALSGVDSRSAVHYYTYDPGLHASVNKVSDKALADGLKKRMVQGPSKKAQAKSFCVKAPTLKDLL